MAVELVLAPAAEQDIDEAYAWSESQGVGRDDFVGGGYQP
jgi:hypothetical protein